MLKVAAFFYCVDHALVTSVSSGILVNSGHLLENLVFTALRRVSPDIFYVRTKSGQEVDFTVKLRDQPRRLIQVCESLHTERTRNREVTALRAAMGALDLTKTTIVTRNEEDQIEVDGGKIDVVPVWRFMLNLEQIESLL